MFYQQLADYNSPQNTLFQNLLQDEVVQDNVKLNDDGAYSWKDNADGTPGGIHEWMAQQMIAEQNTSTTDATSSKGSVADFTDNDTAKFRQLTGYNLVHTGDLTYITDDNGNPPPASETDRLNAAWQMFDNAKGGQFLDSPDGSGADLSYDDLKSAALGLKSQFGSNSTNIDNIIDAIDEMEKTKQSQAA
jgi:hypothetical protein